MSAYSDVMRDLAAYDGDRSKLMEFYSQEMENIQRAYGGSPSDIPANSDHEYHDLKKKLNLLNSLKV